VTRRYAPVRRGELKQPDCTAHIRASIDQAGGRHDERGWYATLVYSGCETRERAIEIKNGLYRAARRAKVSVATQVRPADDGTWLVEFTAINKVFGRAYVAATYGNDTHHWPYDPFHGRISGEETPG